MHGNAGAAALRHAAGRDCHRKRQRGCGKNGRPNECLHGMQIRFHLFGFPVAKGKWRTLSLENRAKSRRSNFF
jgi:hypothetical protein